MTFNPTKPQANDLLSVSQSDLQTNFNQSNTIMGVNHINFDNSIYPGAVPGDRGKHVQVVMKVPTVTPPITAAAEGALYIANTGAAREQLRYRRESNGVVCPLTELIGAYARFDGTTGALIGYSFNVSGVVRVGTRFTVSFSNAMAANTYGVIATAETTIASQIMRVSPDVFDVAFVELEADQVGLNRPQSISIFVVGEIA